MIFCNLSVNFFSMKYLSVLSILVLLFLSNCKNKSEEEEQAGGATIEESTEKLDTVLSANDINVLNQLQFSKFAHSQNQRVEWSDFRMVTSSHEDSLHVSSFQPDSLYYKEYGRFLKYSPDSSMFVDLDSYNIDFQRNRKGQLVPIEVGPDTEVSLVDKTQKEKTRLVFLGPGNGVEDAGWIDNNSVVLVGYHEKDTSKTKTAVLWRYHVPTKTFYVYESPDYSVAQGLLEWRRERLRN